MAHQIEPMDIDDSVCDFDDKENSFHHNNVLPRTPCTEKGYEELDVSELNMKLRYSITPTQSPMSKSYTANCLNNETATLDFENGNMTRSLHSALTNNDTIIKSQKSFSQIGDSNRNILQPLDSTSTIDKISVTVTGTNELEDNLSFPSSSDHTPEATTPTKEIPKEEGSPIMRGLKSVFSMFRPSQSPIPPDVEQLKQEAISPPIVYSPDTSDNSQVASASTPLVAIKTKDPLKRNSSHTNSLVFNENLATELEWKDDSTILSGNEKIPIHKLFFQLPNQSQSKTNPDWTKTLNESEKPKENLNNTEYMEISYNDSGIMDKTNIPNINVSETVATESDGEFVDAESSIQSESYLFKSPETAATLEESILRSAELDNLNITTKTLSAGITEPTDLSSDTVKIEKSADLDYTPTETVAQDFPAQVKEETCVEELGKIDSRILSDNTVAPVAEILTTDNFKPIVEQENVIDNNEAGLPPVTDNVVVSSLAQIPLIADPRVLLFNISSGSVDHVQDTKVKETTDLTDANIKEHAMSPADIPLPDDDDMASLPSMNCALDNISQALDKISKEIPKINRQAVEKEIMQSVTSTDKLLDLTLSNLAEPNVEATSTLVDKGSVKTNLPDVEEAVKSLADLNEEKPPNPVQKEVTAEPEFKLDETQAVIDLIDELTPMSANEGKQILSAQNNLEPMDIRMVEMQPVKTSDSDVQETSYLVNRSNTETKLSLVEEIKSLEEKPNAQASTVESSAQKQEAISMEGEVASQPKMESDETETVVELPDKVSSLGDNRNEDFNLSLAEESVKSIAVLEEEKLSALENTISKTLAEELVLGTVEGVVAPQLEMKFDETTVELIHEPSILGGEGNAQTSLSFAEDSVKSLTNLDEQKPFALEKTQTVDKTPVKENVLQPISVDAEGAQQTEIKLDGAKIEELTPVPANVERQSLALEDVAPVDISMAEIHNTDQTVMIENSDVAHSENCIPASINMPVQNEITEASKESQKEQNVEGDLVNEDFNIRKEISEEVKEATDNLSANEVSFAAIEKPDPLLIESNIEFIKHEVNAIIEKAVDIVKEKIAVQDLGISSDLKSIPALAEPELLPDIVNSEKGNVHANAISENNQVTVDSTVPQNLNTTYDSSTNVTKNNAIEIEINNSNLNLGSVSVEADQNNAELPVAEPVHDVKNSEIIDVLVLNTENIVEDSNDEEIQRLTDDQVVASKTNSPFELVSHNEVIDAFETDSLQKFEEIENRITASSEVLPPSSPAIVSKGYNFNFDEIDDPFATKPKISLSPPPAASPNRIFEQTPEKDMPKKVNNRRKSQPEKKKPVPSNKKMNSTFAGKFKTPAKSDALPRPTVAEAIESTALQIEQKNKLTNLEAKIQETSYGSVEEKHSPADDKNTSAAIEDNITEKSTLGKSGTPSYALVKPKSTFNVPEFDDPNLNPFATKSKVRQSPQRQDTEIDPFATRTKICQTPPPQDIENPFAAKSKICNSIESSMIAQDKSLANSEAMDVDLLSEKCNSKEIGDSAPGEDDKVLNSTTTTSKSEQDNTFNTVNTEDEDTIEGPFLEAEEFNTDEKLPNFVDDNVDMIRFSTGNAGTTDAGEMFIDAEAFEFLLNQNQTNSVTDSGKESLFLKFDPLFSKRVSSDGVLSALNRVQKKQSTPKKSDKPVLRKSATFDISPVPQPRKSIAGPSTPKTTERPNLLRDATFDTSPIPGPSKLNTTQDLDLHNGTEDSYDDLNVTVSKPMMVVNPAVNAVVTPRNKSLTPVRSNRQSLTFTSPAIAVIDRLLSMSSANNSFMTHDSTVAEVRPDSEADLALTQLRELLADKEISVYNLRSETKELQNRLTTMESQMKNLETISEERLKKINELNEKLDEKTRLNKSMAKVVEEYERTIASLIAETEQDKLRHAEERMQLIKERDEQADHLASMEISFNDLHSKYEKSKQIILGFKANEDSYKKSIKEFEDNLSKMQKNYELLKQHATSKLNYANDELQKMNRAHESEVLKLNAMIKRKELHITSLEETLQQKTKANEELTAICDELINKVG